MTKSQTAKPQYGPYILSAIIELGGEATMDQLMEEVYRNMKSVFTSADLDCLYSGTVPRWRNQAEHMLEGLVDDHYVEQGNDRIKITKKGLDYIAKH